MAVSACGRRRLATHPIGHLAQRWAPVAPEAWQLVATRPAIVSPEPFAPVQATLALNHRWAARHQKPHASLLQALVSCAVCQACCLARTTNGGRRYEGCRMKTVPRAGPPAHPWRSPHLPAQQLEDVVWQDRGARLRQPAPMA